VSERRRDLVESVLLTGDKIGGAAEAVARLAERGRSELDSSDEARVRVGYDLRYTGQAFEITVPGGERPDPAELRHEFDAAHEQRYGYSDPKATLELVTLRVTVALPGGDLAPAISDAEPSADRREVIFDSERVDAEVLRGRIGDVGGPVVCELPEATLVVPPGWTGRTDDDGTVVLER
jgi:N-methylhydantoinase A